MADFDSHFHDRHQRFRYAVSSRVRTKLYCDVGGKCQYPRFDAVASCLVGVFHKVLKTNIDVKPVPMNLGKLQVRVADIDLKSCTVQEAVQRVADSYQVDYVTLHLFRSGEDAQNKPYVRTNYPDAWVSHYLLNEYVRIDPVLQMAEQIAGPFCWSIIALKDHQVAMMEQATKHGVGQTGFSVRHIDSIGRRSVLSFNAHSAKGGDSWEPYLAKMRNELIHLAHEIHLIALAEIYVDGETLPQLSPREIECLKWTAAGKAHTDIAIILNLSEHTVRGYLKEARMKLDCVTLAQAVSKASSLGLI